jgi:hypothetical protein
MELKKEDKAYARASATNVQRTWYRYGWVPPSKDPLIIEKWDYFKALHLLSEQALEKSQ